MLCLRTLGDGGGMRGRLDHMLSEDVDPVGLGADPLWFKAGVPP